jgi:hypothetical protein
MCIYWTRCIRKYCSTICMLLLYMTSSVSSDEGVCAICPPNKFCRETMAYDCPPNQISNAGSLVSTACRCRPGYYGADGEGCTSCPINSFCSGGLSISECRENYESPSASNSSLDCLCPMGWYLWNGGQWLFHNMH